MTHLLGGASTPILNREWGKKNGNACPAPLSGSDSDLLGHIIANTGNRRKRHKCLLLLSKLWTTISGTHYHPSSWSQRHTVTQTITMLLRPRVGQCTRGIACSALYNHDQLTSSRLLVSQSIEVGHNDNSLRSPLPLAATLQEICEMEYFFRLWLQNDAKSQRGDLLAQRQYQGQQLSFRKRLRTEVWWAVWVQRWIR